jgi:hypothetical protein
MSRNAPRTSRRARSLFVLAAVTVAFAGLPAAAGAGQQASASVSAIGIGEQSPQIFSNPYFTALGVKRVRYITAWNSLRYRWSRDMLDEYLFAARAAGVEVLLGFGHARSAKRNVRRRVPSVKAFTRAFLEYRQRYPWVKDWVTWNEANHCGEPTCHKARRVARFYNSMRHNCPGCRVVGADVLDTPTMGPWIREFKRTARKDKMIWGLHNYIDANRFRTSGTRELLGLTRRGQVWFTETGGLVVRRNRSKIAFPGSERHAAAATRQVFRLAALSSRVRRIYLYHWQPSASALPTWDSALLDRRGRPRAAYRVLKAHIRRQTRLG